MLTIAIIFSILQLAPAYDFTCNFTLKAWTRQPRLHLNPREVLAPTAHSFSLIVDSTDEVVSRTILQTGTWQPQILTLISKLIKPGQRVLNLGSQTGLQAILMGKMVGEHGEMYIFEPYSVSYKMAVKNIYLNGLESISRIYKVAAGNSKSLMKLWIDSDNTGHSSLVQEKGGEKAYQEIEVDRVDSIVSEAMDFALIDVEMFEVNALLGMQNLLAKSPSMIILLEWRYLDNPNRDEERARELISWLLGKRYRWFHYAPNSDACQLGTIKQIPHQQLLTIIEEDLLLVGPNAILDMFKL